MSKKITYHWGDSQLLISLGNRLQTRIKILFLAEFVFTTGMATIFLLQALPLSGKLAHWVAACGASVLYLMASYRLLSRMFETEKLLLDKNDLVIVRKTPFSIHSARYNWQNIGPLHYAGKGHKTDHPLKGHSFDYFGFETHEHLVQSLHHNGNLCFSYDDYTVTFAKGVYSWDAEDMVYIMKLYVGNALRLGPEWEQMLQAQEMGDNQ